MRRSSYAIWWADGDSPRRAGKLELGGLHLLLSGNGSGRLAIPFDEITSVDYVRGELRVGRRGAAMLRIGNLDAPGALLEVRDSLRPAA